MIKYEPDKLLRKIAPKTKIKKLLKANLSLKKTALRFADKTEFIDKKNVEDTALKVIKSYKKRIKEDPDLEDEIKADPKQLIQRVQNEIVFQVHEKIKEKYGGERAVWLPSSAIEPRPEHQLNYGVEYIIGEGIDGVEPGDEWGCQCGVQILVDDTQLEL